MRVDARRPRRRLADERGMTLPELLVAALIGLLAAAGGMVLLQVAIRSQPDVADRASQIQQGRTLLETISRELRQGQSIEAATATGLEVMTYVNSDGCGGPASEKAILCRVTYACEGATCTRAEHDSDGSGATVLVASGLRSPAIFRYCEQGPGGASCELTSATYPTYVGVELGYPSGDGGEAITLVDGVALRNYFVPQGSG